VERAVQVDVDHRLPLVERRAEHALAEADPGVVDEDVEATGSFSHVLDGARPGRRVGHVEGDALDAGRCGEVVLQIAREDPCPFGREARGLRCALALRRARHEDDPTVETPATHAACSFSPDRRS